MQNRPVYVGGHGFSERTPKARFDDALDLAACAGLVAPLVNLPMGTGMAVSVDPVGFIRRQFTLQMVLLVVRMHEQPREGQTGTTASIQALLDAAALEGRVSQEFRDAYVNVLERSARSGMLSWLTLFIGMSNP